MKFNFNIRNYYLSLLLMVILSMLCWHAAYSQNCPGSSYHLRSQAEVDAFPAGCSTVLGDLRISSSISDVTDLSPLAGISQVEGDLDIFGNDNLLNLNGLAGVITVGGDLRVAGNDKLINLSGLANLSNVGRDLKVTNNRDLPDLDGLSNINAVGRSLEVSDHPSLLHLNGLSNIVSIGGGLIISNNPLILNLNAFSDLSSFNGKVFIGGNTALMNLDGLSNVSSIYDLRIIQNGLLNLDALSNISIQNFLRIDGNPMLINLDGFANLMALDSGLVIINNDALQNLDGLSNLEWVGESVTIENNISLSSCCSIIPLLDEIDDGAPGPGEDPIPDVRFGVWIANNGPTCNSVAEILAPPTAVCKNFTVTFGTEASNLLDLADLWDEAASSTNCNDLWVADYFPTVVNCSDIGTVVPVMLTLLDDGNKTAECIANVTIDGIACGWAGPEDGVGCPGGSSGDFSGGTFTVSSEGCYDPDFYSSSDAQGMIASELCGDGEIIVQVTNVDGSGFGGISMRESMAPDAKKLQLMIDGVMLTRRELRNSTGGLAFAHVFQTQGKNWLRLTRTGNMFSAYHSSDGASWSAVLITTIDMATCISVGLMAKSNSADDIVEATFEHVFITGLPASATELPASFDIAQEMPVEEQVWVYPNPATDELIVDLQKFQGNNVHVQVLNGQQQVALELDFKEADQKKLTLDVSRLVDGIYYLRLLSEKEQVIRKFVKCTH